MIPYAMHIYHWINFLITNKKKTYFENLGDWDYNMVDEPPMAIETTKG